MKQYGAMKATEFTKKQISVVYAKAKKGELKVEKWIMSEMYDLADFYNYDNGSVEFSERIILCILRAVFAGDNEAAQANIDLLTKHKWDASTEKRRANFDRSLVG